MGILDKLRASAPAVTTTTTAVAGPSVASSPIRIRENKGFPWRRFLICIVGIVILLFVWRWSVNHLYTLPPTSIAVFGSITTSTLYAITFIVAYFITGQVYFTNWSNVTTSNIAAEVKAYFESKKKDPDDKPAKGKK